MEPISAERVRLKLLLGKFPVTKIDKDPLGPGFIFVLALPNSINMTVTVPAQADVREGDLLSVYTEVLTHANPQSTPIQ